VRLSWCPNENVLARATTWLMGLVVGGWFCKWWRAERVAASVGLAGGGEGAWDFAEG